MNLDSRKDKLIFVCSQVPRGCFGCEKSYPPMRLVPVKREHSIFPYPIILCVKCRCTVNEPSERSYMLCNIFVPITCCLFQLTIMHASCQEKFKHAIPPQSAIDIFRPSSLLNSMNPLSSKATTSSAPLKSCTADETMSTVASAPSNCRINITFRFYRPDFRPESIPRCDCRVPTILRPDMKNRTDGLTDKYWWTCYASAQNDGKGCKFWRVMDMKKENRGPCVGDHSSLATSHEEPLSP